MKTKTGKSNLDIVRSYLSGEKAFQSVGWTPDLKPRADGEVWEIGGQKWTMKDGKKQPLSIITKYLDATRQECGDCKKNMKLFNDRLDDKMFPKTGRCYDCQIKFESELKRTGKYEAYEKEKIFSNQKSYCLDMKAKLLDTIKHLENADNKIKYMNEDGTEEYWTDTTRENVLVGAKKELDECNSALERIEEQLKALKNG